MLAGRRDAKYLCVFDVGADVGDYLRVVLDGLAGVNVAVHAFEPSGVAFARLSERYNGHPSVRLNNLALADKPGERTPYSDVPGSGVASLTRRRVDHFGVDFACAETVRVTTLDDYCGEHGVQRIDLLKLDVEGHELDVLVGGQRLFSAGGVKIVAFEFGGCSIDTRTFLQDFYYFFRDHRMQIARITPSGHLHPLGEYREIDEQFRTTNFVAYRAS
jgi:FkbM family methyltransferase